MVREDRHAHRRPVDGDRSRRGRRPITRTGWRDTRASSTGAPRATRPTSRLGGDGGDREKSLQAGRDRGGVQTGSKGAYFLQGENAPTRPLFMPGLDEVYEREAGAGAAHPTPVIAMRSARGRCGRRSRRAEIPAHRQRTVRRARRPHARRDLAVGGKAWRTPHRPVEGDLSQRTQPDHREPGVRRSGHAHAGTPAMRTGVRWRPIERSCSGATDRTGEPGVQALDAQSPMVLRDIGRAPSRRDVQQPARLHTVARGTISAADRLGTGESGIGTEIASLVEICDLHFADFRSDRPGSKAAAVVVGSTRSRASAMPTARPMVSTAASGPLWPR